MQPSNTNTTCLSTTCGTQHRHPPTTRSRPQQPSVRGPPTPGQSPCHPGTSDERPSSPLSASPVPDRHTSHRTPPREPPEYRTPQAGDRLDGTGQVLRVGDEVSFLATQGNSYHSTFHCDVCHSSP